MCAHHTPSHQPLSTFVGMCAPNFNNHPSSISLSLTLHQPIIFWAPPCPIPPFSATSFYRHSTPLLIFAHTHPPFVNCHQLRICPMPMGHHHPPSTSFSTSSPSISCGPHYPCHMPAPLWPGVSSALQLGRSFGGVG